MKGRVLVCYATRYGSTAEIGQVIGETLRAEGLQPDVVPVSEVGALKPYTGVIIGSPIYMGKWLPEAIQFVKDHQIALSHRQVAAFTVGYSLKDRLEEHLRNADRALDSIRLYVELIDTALFAGRVVPDVMTMADRSIITLGGVKPGDYRDWREIKGWAAALAKKIGQVN